MKRDTWCCCKPNTTRGEAKALKELRQDMDKVILTVDKGVAMVVPEKQDYINKAQDILVKRDTYRPLPADPTNK